MEKNFTLIFDDVIIRELKKAAKNEHLKSILSTMLDKLESFGPDAGKLLDSRLFLYEIKNKHPPLRLYFKPKKGTNEIFVFEFEMKTSEETQQKTISRLRQKVHEI